MARKRKEQVIKDEQPVVNETPLAEVKEEQSTIVAPTVPVIEESTVEKTSTIPTIEEQKPELEPKLSKLDKVITGLGEDNLIGRLIPTIRELDKKPSILLSQQLILELMVILRTPDYNKFKKSFDQLNKIVAVTKDTAFSDMTHHSYDGIWTITDKQKTILQLLVAVLNKTYNRNTRNKVLASINTRHLTLLLDEVSSANFKRYYNI